jgi:phosphate transport system permease protein
MSFHYRMRRWKNLAMMVILGAMAALAIIPLVSVLIYVIQKGGTALNHDLFFELPKPVGEIGGGLANAFLGSLTLLSLASAIGIPFGIATGIYLSEYSRGRVAFMLRFAIDLLTSVPSIVIGLFAYSVVVKPMHTFSAHAGGFALAIILVPIVARSTEEMLKLVPKSVREAGLALGIPRWRVTLSLVLRGAVGGILTGVILAMARVIGETAPILFTAFNNRGFSESLNQPIASLPVTIYTYAISPYDEWHAQAWAGALVLMLFVLAINLISRFIAAKKGM